MLDSIKDPAQKRQNIQKYIEILSQEQPSTSTKQEKINKKLDKQRAQATITFTIHDVLTHLQKSEDNKLVTIPVLKQEINELKEEI